MPALLGAWGLRIESELDVSGAVSFFGESSPPDLSIVIGEARLPDFYLPDSYKTDGPYRSGPAGLLFDMPGVARYLCHPGGARLTVEPLASAAPEQVSAMLIATALPAMLWLRGEIVLHAAAALPPGMNSALAFAGASGSGKSRLLEHMVEAGATAVADDTLCLRGDVPGAVEASGLPTSMFLRRVSAAGERERTAHAIPAERQARRAYLSALVVLGSLGGEFPTRLHGADALSALLRNLHRPRVPRLLGQTPTLLPRLARLVNAIPVYSWNLQGDPESGLAALMRLPRETDQGKTGRRGGPE